MTYHEFMVAKYINANDSCGDLARYLYHIKSLFPDAEEPSDENLKKIRIFLNDKFVPDGIMYAFEDSWREYKKRCWKKKSKENSAKESKTEEA